MVEPDTRLIDLESGGRGMGFFDNLKDALGGDREDDGAAAVSAVSSVPVSARHVDHAAPAERADDAAMVTGGKHAARD
jgi:hypothetical protein